MQHIIRRWGLVIAPLPFVAVELAGDEFGSLLKIGAIVFWMLVWWISEAVPIAATALLPLVLFPMAGLMKGEAVAKYYGNSVIFLFFGGFVLALGLEKHGLHRRIAFSIMRLFGKSSAGLLAGFLVATGFLSMWVSNTATTVMLLPIALSVSRLLAEEFAARGRTSPLPAQALLLAIAYGASIGGTATIVGTPPNVVLVGFLSNSLNYEITFLQWLVIGVPFAVLMLAILYSILRIFYCRKSTLLNIDLTSLSKNTSPHLSSAEKGVAGVFGLTAALWIFRPLISEALSLPFLSDSVIAMTGAILLFVLPFKSEGPSSATPLLSWQDTNALPWGILLLFGGGLALAGGMEEFGVMKLIGDQITTLDISFLFFLVVVVFLTIALTEVMSNVALVTVFLPIIAGAATSLGFPQVESCICVALAASCAFMLPMSTPPNAIVFGGGHLSIAEMSKVGIVLNILAIAIISLLPFTLLLVV